MDTAYQQLVDDLKLQIQFSLIPYVLFFPNDLKGKLKNLVFLNCGQFKPFYKYAQSCISLFISLYLYIHYFFN